MRKKLWSLAAGFVLATVATTPASAFEKWSGPGYYLLEAYYLKSGPYLSESDCNAALAAVPQKQREDTNAYCEYEATDPNTGDNLALLGHSARLKRTQSCLTACPNPARPTFVDEVLDRRLNDPPIVGALASSGDRRYRRLMTLPSSPQRQFSSVHYSLAHGT